MAIVIDCTQSPSIDALRGAGVTGVCRYLSWLHYWNGTTHTHVNPKIIQLDEYKRLTGAGLGVVLNWEFGAQDWLGGAAAGVTHATEAVLQARALGHPTGEGRAIIGSADFDMSLSQWTAAGRGYAEGFSKVIRDAGYAAGAYGPWDVLTWCHDAGLADIFWQAGMSWSWSGGRNANVHPAAHLFQQKHQNIGGIDVDVNVILKPDYGQHPIGGTVSDWSELGAPKNFPYSGDVAAADVQTVLRTGDHTAWDDDDGKGWWIYKKVEQTAADAAAARKAAEIAAAKPAGVVLSDTDRAAIIADLKADLPTAADIAKELIAQLGNG